MVLIQLLCLCIYHLAGADFEAIPGVDSFLFPAGSSFNDTVCVDVDILEDLLFEGNELFMLLALEPNRGVVDPSTANITIIDNECKLDLVSSECASVSYSAFLSFHTILLSLHPFSESGFLE